MKLQIKIIAVAALALVALVFVWRGSAAASTGPECTPGGGFVPRFCVTVPAGPAIRRETTVALASVASRTADLRVEAGIPAGEALRVAGALDRAAAQVERAFGRSFSERPRVLLFATPKSFAQGIEDLFVYPSDVARTAAASYGGIVDQRTLTVAVDFRALGERTLILDCDVLVADGGTRTASITGAWVALALAASRLREAGLLAAEPLRHQVAAVSVGIVGGTPRLDLDYLEDSAADTDMNCVGTEDGRYVELQGTAEREPFDQAQVDALLGLARRGLDELFTLQRDAVARGGG